MLEVGKYNRESTDADFVSDLVVEGVVLEILSLNTILKIFKNSSILYLMTEALKPLLLMLNRKQSCRLYFRDCICQLRAQFRALRSGSRGSTLLKIFKKSSIVNLTTEALKPLLLLNHYRS